jgi:hypothetical protein
MVLTILEATVAPDRAADLQAAFRAAAGEVPAGLVRSHLVASIGDPTQWRIETLMFRAAGAEPALSIYDVAATIEAPPA